MLTQLEGRNPVWECLKRRQRRVLHIWLDQGARTDGKIQRLLDEAQRQKIQVTRVARAKLDEMAQGRVHNGVVAKAEPLRSWTTARLIDDLFSRGEQPFVVLVDTVSYEHNLGAVLRSSLGFGVNGLIVPTKRGAPLSPVVARVAMGAAEVVPVVREGMYSALKAIKKAGIVTVGADMHGTPLADLNLRGPIAFVLGGEDKGLTENLRSRCDHVASVPLSGGLQSLNVSVAAAVMMYEKRRQDGWMGADSDLDEPTSELPLISGDDSEFL